MQIKNREDLAKHFAERNYNVGAEIGVLAGEYAEVLCKANPNLKLYCVDYWPSNYHQQQFHAAQRRLKDYNVEFIAKKSLDAVKDFKDHQLDFVYIDASHQFDDVMQDIIEWKRKVRKGGIVAGHDYEPGTEYRSMRDGVREAIDVYVKVHRFRLQTTTTDPNTEETRSWWFDKKWN